MHLEGLLIEDRQKDTLLYAGEARVRITDWFFIKKNIVLKYVGLKNAVIKMQRNTPVWNHQFLIDYFSSPSSSGEKSGGGTELSLEKMDLLNVYFVKKDAWLGQNMTVGVGSLQLDTKDIDLSKKTIDLGSLVINKPYFALFNYQRLKPAPAPDTYQGHYSFAN